MPSHGPELRPDPPLAVDPPPGALAALVRHSLDGLALTDGDGLIRWVNPAFVRLTGHDAASACGQALDRLICSPHADAATRLWMARRLRDGEGFDTIELHCRHADGRDRWLAVRAARVDPRRRGEGFVLALADLTEAQREAQERRRLAELLDMAQEFGRLGVWERDVRTLQGRWDRHVFRFWGLDPSEGTPDFAAAAKYIHPDDRADAVLRDSMQRAGTYAQRYRVLRADGTVRLLHSQWEVKNGPSGMPERVIGIMVDDTEVYELAQGFSDAQAQLNLAVDLARLAVWRQELATGQFVCNERAWEVIGLPPRAEGLPIEELRSRMHPDDLAGIAAASRRAMASGQPADVEVRYRRADGSWRYLLTRRVGQRDANGEPAAFLGVALDVTEQVEGSRRASELARRLESATQAAGVGLWSTEVDTGALDWNEQMFELFGLRRDAQPRTYDEWLRRCVHPDDAQRVDRSVREWLRSGQSLIELEYRARLPDGSVRWLVNRSNKEHDRRSRYIYGITIDVTAQHEAMQALRSANERSALVARGVGIGTWELDLLTGQAFWDEQMFALRGLPSRERALSTAERMALVHPDDRGVASRVLDEALAQGRPADYEFRVRLPDGSYRWLASRSTAVFDDQGRPLRRIGVNWDVTEIKMAEIARQEKAVALRESQAKSEFLARMSHELRTPLNAVLGFTQLLIAEVDQVDRQSLLMRLQHIRSAGQHLLSLINDVLDLSSLDTGELRMASAPVVVAELVQQTLPLVERMAQEREVQLHAGPLPGLALGDPTRLRQVLLNLLSNAIKYNRPGGSVSIDTQCEDGPQGPQLRLRVSDSGRGMSAEQLRHVFEPFNRLGIEREGIEGTGIGLTIVKALVERMGGSVLVRSEAGQGTVFEVLLRRVDALPPPPLATPVPEPAGFGAPVHPGRGARLLYIEDNPVNAMIVRELVASRPALHMEVASDGESGVRRAIETRPDLVLVDMQLPDIDGREVLARLRAHPVTARIPCIALSANAMAQDMAQALAAGFADYWTKPLDFKAFLGALDALFG
jgi:hypothetical protein